MNSPEQKLDIHSVTAIVGAVNNEGKIVLMHFTPGLDSGDWASAKDIHEGIEIAGGFGDAREVTPAHIGLNLQRATRKGFLIAAHNETYQRSEAGEIALGFGGLLLDTGIRNCVPVKTLVGEDGQALRPNGSVRDGIESRLAILTTLYNQNPKKWMSLLKMISEIEPFGIGENGIRHAFGRLVQARIAEQRLVNHPNKPGTKLAQVRLRTVEGTEYRNAVGEYLGCIASLATMDVEKLSEGQDKAREVIEHAIENNTLTKLIQRAQQTTPRFGRTAVRNGYHTKGHKSNLITLAEG